MVSEAQKRADLRYKKARTKQISLRFYPSEMDIWDHLGKQGNRSGYIKGLIRSDMEK